MKMVRTVIAFLLMLTMLSACVSVAAASREIELVSAPSRTVFYEGKDWEYYDGRVMPSANFDLTGAAVRIGENVVHYYVFPWGGNMWAEPESGKWVVGENQVRIYVDTDNEDLYARSVLTLVAIRSIEITEYPKTVMIRGVDWEYDALGYIASNPLDLTGLAIKINYGDGTSELLRYGKTTKDRITYAVPESTGNLTLGQNTYNICYSSKRADLQIDYQLESITRASVSAAPAKVNYEYKKDWQFVSGSVVPTIDLNGLAVTAVYNNGTSKTVTYRSEPSRFSVKAGQRFFCGSNTCTILLDGQYPFNIYFDILRYGDINVDGEVNSGDALLALRHSVGSVTLEDSQFKFADVNLDGKVNSADALAIINFSVGLTTSFPAEKA